MGVDRKVRVHVRCNANIPKENSRAFTPSIALTEMNAAVWGIAASECRAAWAQCARGSRLCPPAVQLPSQPEDMEHQGLALLLEFRRAVELPSRARARPRHDSDVLPSADLRPHPSPRRP